MSRRAKRSPHAATQKPVFEIFDATRRTRLCAIYADGRVEGFKGCKVTFINRIPALIESITRALVDGGVHAAADRVRKDFGL